MTRRRTAFTLVELLTVIAILTLLVGILLPSLQSARRSAKANVCLSHLKGIGTAFSIYLNENEDAFPPFQLLKSQPAGDQYFINGYGRFRPRWQWFLETDFGPVINPLPFKWLIDSSGFFDDDTPSHDNSVKHARIMSNELFTCPSLVDDEFAFDIRDGAYGYNYQYLGNPRTDSRTGRWDNFSVGLHRIRSTAGTVLVADSRGAGGRHGKHSFTLDPPRMASEAGAKRFGPVYAASDEYGEADLVEPDLPTDFYAYSPAEPRHNNRSNTVFVDAHAEAISLAGLGYQLNDGKMFPDLRVGTPVGVPHAYSGTYTADNRMFNGEGTDPIAAEHKPAVDDGGGGAQP